MKKKDSDIFEGNKSQHHSSENFFLQNSISSISESFSGVSEPTRRLNDYDFNLLEEDAYKDINDDLFKLEYKISKIEQEIKTLEYEMQAATEIGDDVFVQDLKTRKVQLIEDYDELLNIYNAKSLSGKISDKIFGFISPKFKANSSIFQSKVSFIMESILSKMPKQISSVFELKKSLLKLEYLNKSVDELVSLNIPYGENVDKYEQLSKYIIKANSIQAELSKYLKDK